MLSFAYILSFYSYFKDVGLELTSQGGLQRLLSWRREVLIMCLMFWEGGKGG